MSPGASYPHGADTPAGPGAAPAEEHNRSLARSWFEQAWGAGDVGAADEVFSPDFRLRGRKVGPQGPVRSVLSRRAAFADMSVRIEHIVAEGPYVLTHFSTSARHVGEFHGVPPSGRTVHASGIVLWRVEEGRVVEDWNCFDTLKVLRDISSDARTPRSRSEE